MSTAAAYWRARATTVGPGWMDTYWDSYQRAYRHQLADAIDRVPQPIYSILEVGCNAGPNLRLWRERWPRVCLMGFDISAEAIAFARQKFIGDISVAAWEQDLLDSRLWLPHATIIASCYALAYVAPSELPSILRRLADRAGKALIVAEPTVVGESQLLPNVGWAHDYPALLADLGGRVESEVIHEPVDGLNAIHTTWRPT